MFPALPSDHYLQRHPTRPIEQTTGGRKNPQIDPWDCERIPQHKNITNNSRWFLLCHPQQPNPPHIFALAGCPWAYETQCASLEDPEWNVTARNQGPIGTAHSADHPPTPYASTGAVRWPGAKQTSHYHSKTRVCRAGITEKQIGKPPNNIQLHIDQL